MSPTTSSTPPPTTTSSTPSSDPAERLAYLALALIEGLGPRRIAQLLSCAGSAERVFANPALAVGGLRVAPPGLMATLRRPPMQAARDLIEQCATLGYHILTPADAEFPALLRSIPDPPPLLYAAGNLALTNVEAIAIVGSRNHTRYGGEVAERLGAVAAEAGLVVASGMARGLDAVAQRAAHTAGGTSIGVLGTGIDIVYPRENHELFELVARDGLLLTEYPLGTPPNPGSFPRRNRLISGLARALVVVEAAENSGTLITVSTALEQGRDVLVVPGPINSVNSSGTNRLLRDGAVPILEPSDILIPYGIVARPGVITPRPVAAPCTLSPTEARVFAALTAEGQSVDDLAELIGIPVGELLAALLGLELGGLVQQLAGAMYRQRQP
ncbi:MAG: DNA-processing protein DprA [Gemmatimonadales bacterium]